MKEEMMKKGKSRLKNSFFRGLLFLLPVALTLYVVYYIARLVYTGLDFIIELVPESYTGSVLYQASSSVHRSLSSFSSSYSSVLSSGPW
jgi:uncharacterized membrane protein